MFRNYFKIAIRSLWRNKSISAINILGFAVGITTCLLILLFLQNEFSYDRYNQKADRIVRVVFRGQTGAQETKEANVMPPLARAFKSDFPEVEEATRICPYGMPRITYGDKTFRENAFAFVDSNFFRVFTLPFIEGNAQTALSQPNTVVISRAVAEKYFGKTDPLGKVLEFKDNNSSLTVTGVFDKVPLNSHFHFDLFAAMSELPGARVSSWMTSGFYTYLVLPEGYDYKKLEAKLPAEIDKYIGPQMQQGIGMTLSQFRQKGNQIGFALQPVTDIHLHSDYTGDMEPHGDFRYIYIFSAVGLFMLLIACINFMNLSTAGASKRAKEVGIRKVMGSVKGQLVRQFLLESFLLTSTALLLALALVRWTLPFFNDLAGQNLSLQLRNNLWVIPALAGFGLFIGFLAGSYPAFYLSSFNPASVLKGKFTAGKRSSGFRSGLVVFQFFISIGLMVATIVVYQQLSYIRHKKLGYDKDQVLILQDTYQLGHRRDLLRQKLLENPEVISLSVSDFLPAGPSNASLFYAYPDDQSTTLVKTQQYNVDVNYIPTMGMELAAGRNFSPSFGADSAGIIINEAAASAYGWGQKALGHTIIRKDQDGKKLSFIVIGVVKDFHFQSLHERIAPLAMTLGPNLNQNQMIVKVKTKNIAGLLNKTEKEWKVLDPGVPFSYSFLDQRFYNTYKAEQNIGHILAVFAGLTILVACMGLFGLATFSAEQRTREIGIRKVLGASVFSIVSLLSRDFLRLVLLAFIIAAPVTWYVMNRWLEDFAYRVSINGWVFAGTAGLAICLTLFTIGFHAFKAARANPTDSLKMQ